MQNMGQSSLESNEYSEKRERPCSGNAVRAGQESVCEDAQVPGARKRVGSDNNDMD